MEKIKAIDPKIVVSGSADKPYYSIEYYNISDKRWHIGYGSYSLKFVKEWLNDDFEIVEADIEPVRCGEWANEETAVTCTACGRSYDTDFEIKRNVILSFDFCPNCGAKMDNNEVECEAKRNA